MKKSIGFIGGGRITRIFLQAFKNKNLSLDRIWVSEIDPKIASQLRSDFPRISICEPSIAASKDIVFIALHPPVIAGLLEDIESAVSSASILVSLAPKITMGEIAGKLKKTDKIVRLIPNATSYINEGYNPVSFSYAVTEEEKDEVLELLRLLGHTFETEEHKLEAYAIVSAMAPTYFWFQWRTLGLIGEEIGLDKAEAAETVYKTLQAALDLLYTSGLPPEEVLDLIPVKPIGDHEPVIDQMYHEKLIGLHRKIRP
jgi:pyrroline-5-carboxylate reductase